MAPKNKGTAGKGKGSGGGGDGGSKGGKDELGTCTFVKGMPELPVATFGDLEGPLTGIFVTLFAAGDAGARHILCEKQGKVMEAYKKLQEGWLDQGDKVPPSKFGEVAQQFSECSSGKKGGDLGWFPRGKMAGPFQDVAFATPIGATSAPFKST